MADNTNKSYKIANDVDLLGNDIQNTKTILGSRWDTESFTISTPQINSETITGNVTVTTGKDQATSGSISITTGKAETTVGDINIYTSDTDTGKSGDITIHTGTGTNANGTVSIYGATDTEDTKYLKFNTAENQKAHAKARLDVAEITDNIYMPDAAEETACKIVWTNKGLVVTKESYGK